MMELATTVPIGDVPLVSAMEGGNRFGYELHMCQEPSNAAPYIYELRAHKYSGQLHTVNLPSGICVLVRPDDLSRLMDPNQIGPPAPASN